MALVGESGVGKSTLVDLISGYHFPEKGTVEIDGHDIRTIDLHRLRSRIAVVPQEVVLFNDTIETNIKYGNFQRIRGRSQRSRSQGSRRRFHREISRQMGTARRRTRYKALRRPETARLHSQGYPTRSGYPHSRRAHLRP